MPLSSTCPGREAGCADDETRSSFSAPNRLPIRKLSCLAIPCSREPSTLQTASRSRQLYKRVRILSSPAAHRGVPRVDRRYVVIRGPPPIRRREPRPVRVQYVQRPQVASGNLSRPDTRWSAAGISGTISPHNSPLFPAATPPSHHRSRSPPSAPPLPLPPPLPVLGLKDCGPCPFRHPLGCGPQPDGRTG